MDGLDSKAKKGSKDEENSAVENKKITVKNKTRRTPNYNRKVFKRFFLTTSVLAACALVLVMGFMVVQYNTNNMGLGEPSMKVDVYLGEGSVNANILAREYKYNLSPTTKTGIDELSKVIPAPLMVMKTAADIPRQLTEKLLDFVEDFKTNR